MYQQKITIKIQKKWWKYFVEFKKLDGNMTFNVVFLLVFFVFAGAEYEYALKS